MYASHTHVAAMNVYYKQLYHFSVYVNASPIDEGPASLKVKLLA